MERIATRLGALHVERLGSGPALFCWPSLFCDARTLRPIADGLGRDHEVILIDGPGHGRSGGVARRFTLEESADAAMEVLDALQVQCVRWIGSAWGGHVGLIAALRHPARVQALVTMNAPMDAWTGRVRAMNAAMYWTFRLLGRPARLARKVASMMVAPARLAGRPELAFPVVDCMLHSERAPFFAAVHSAMFDRPSLLPRLGELRVPTLFLTGPEDGLFPVETARAQAAAIPGAQFEVIAGTAHLSAWEAPEAVLPILRSFLDGLAHDEAASPRGAPAVS